MNKQDIIKWLKKYNITNYIINNDMSVDVNGDVNLVNKNLTKIPIKFNEVKGDFYCSHNKLTTLKGCPKAIQCVFDFYGNVKLNNNIKAFINIPKDIKYWKIVELYLTKEERQELINIDNNWIPIVSMI